MRKLEIYMQRSIMGTESTPLKVQPLSERVGIDVNCRHNPSLATISCRQATTASFSKDEGVAKGRIGRV
jgi:hypothetical protein